jgi:hypothetical protein
VFFEPVQEIVATWSPAVAVTFVGTPGVFDGTKTPEISKAVP